MGLDLNSGVGLLKLGTVIIGLVCFVASFIGYFQDSDYTFPENHFLHDRTPEEECKKAHNRTDCPQTWLALISIIIICLAFCLSFIMLIVLLFIDIGGPFKMIDFIGHIIAGVLMICAGIFLIVYVFELDKYWCRSRGCPSWSRGHERGGFFTGFIITGVSCLIDGIIYIVAGYLVFKS